SERRRVQRKPTSSRLCSRKRRARSEARSCGAASAAAGSASVEGSVWRAFGFKATSAFGRRSRPHNTIGRLRAEFRKYTLRCSGRGPLFSRWNRHFNDGQAFGHPSEAHRAARKRVTGGERDRHVRELLGRELASQALGQRRIHPIRRAQIEVGEGEHEL